MGTSVCDKKGPSRRALLVLTGSALMFFAMVAGCTGSNDNASAPSPAVAPPAASASDDAGTAAAARTAINDLHASWQPYVTDVTFSSGVLRVALQVDRDKDKALAEDVAQAVETLVGLTPELGDVDWVEVTDGAGVHIAQVQVNR